MSNELKCPVCGFDKFGTIKPLIAVCDACQFRCGYSDLPRIVTAMELARATVKVNECEAPANSVVHDYDRTVRRVLKTWQEE